MRKIIIEIKKVKELTQAEKSFINKNRLKEFGRGAIINFKKDYEPNTLFFFVRDGREVVAFVGLRPIRINYLGRCYRIRGICSLISVKKRKGYGRILIGALLSYLKKTGESALGFTHQTEFCQKAGLGVKKGFIKRFIYKNPKTGEEVVDTDGDGVFYNGRDNFIKRVLSTKSKVYIPVPHW